MQDFAFYNVGCDDKRGVKGVLVLARRLLRRVLRPVFLRQAELFRQLAEALDDHEHRVYAQRVEIEAVKQRQHQLAVRQDDQARYHDILAGRQDELADQLQTTMAFGWDYVAFVRRLATLEDQVAALTGSVPGTTSGEEGDIHPSILFPGLEKVVKKPVKGDDGSEFRSKVC